MELSLYTLILLPAALGLLGFVEPCTIGGHLMFLETQKNRDLSQKIKAVLVFIAVRAGMAGMFGLFIALLGRVLIGVQTGLWLVFGSIYLLIGLAFLLGRAGLVKRRIDFAPQAWRRAQNPLVLGLAFGLNIPACAAPILFGLLGLAATTGTVLSGFFMMFVFGLFLSMPLLAYALVPRWARALDRMAVRFVHARGVIGVVFVLLGLWSIWFGMYVDPADWSGL